MNKHIIPILVILLFIVSAVSPMVIGYTSVVSEQKTPDEEYAYNRFSEHYYPEGYLSGQYPLEGYADDVSSRDVIEYKEKTVTEKKYYEPQQNTMAGGPMDSAWPMYCHDTRHTGRSPYSTVDNPGDEKWRFDLSHTANGDVVIDDNGIIYFGANGLYALFPNGTLKWKHITHFLVDGAPAIAEDGTIYFGTVYGSPSYLYALNRNGTLKWKYNPGDSVFSSPVIGNDGTIYFGSANKYINALWSNGTLRWRYKTDHVVYSSPAIGEDGIIYCGSHDTYLYALYLNGTLKWRYKTGDWIRVSPCIGDDGTIYVTSLDYYLYAINPNGTMKWKTDVGAGTSPTIGQDGIIYCGYDKLYAVYPDNGSVRWMFDVSGKIRGGTPCNSIDGRIYLGTSGGWIYAVNPDGTENWCRSIGECESAPAIGEDGTIYVGSTQTPDDGYFFAIGIGELEADADGPHYGLINKPVQFNGIAVGGYRPYSWLWDFGDSETSDEQNPSHIYDNPGNYTVILNVSDDSGNTSEDSTWAWIQESNNPPDKPGIDGEINGKMETSYDYNFTSTDPEGLHIWYYVEWGDGQNTGWIGPYMSGETITKSHTWWVKGEFTIRCKAKDPYGDESEWGILEVTMPKNQQSQNVWFLQWLERFPILQKILDVLRLNN